MNKNNKKALHLIIASRLDLHEYQKLSAMADAQGINKARLIRGIVHDYINSSPIANNPAM